MRDFALLFRGGDLIHDRLSPAEMQAILDRWRAWVATMDAEGQRIGGEKLENHGRTVQPGGIVTDGPFAEAKELLGGFIAVRVPDYDAAVAVASRCPGLETGMTVEVREIRR